jgi:CDP-2,3-bis-(O-geranylgeranyl)-sn-glycerol synthase
VLAALTMAGVAQTAWFRSAWSHRFLLPLDGGRQFRGRRIFGANKTLRGFMVMVPATAAAFATLAMLLGPRGIEHSGLWPLSLSGYWLLGAVAGFGFMAGELPNSFVKRRLGIGDGRAAVRGPAQVAQFLADRLDSGIGMLVAMTFVVPVPALAWVYVLGLGMLVHWFFSVVMFRLGVKARPA